MRKLILIIFSILITEISSQCQIIDGISCVALEEEFEIPEKYDIYGFQTPPRNDALGNYLSTFQDMRYIVGWIELLYNAVNTDCKVTFNTKVNPDLGIKGKDYHILYTFGNQDETKNNYLTVTDDESYPNGFSVSCRVINEKTGNEVVSLKLQDVYFIWDNIEVDTPPEYLDGQRGAIVELFGWPMEDVGEECEFLGIAGYLGVKIFSPYESLLSETMTEGSTLNPWWYGTQVVSYKYDCRSGNQKQLKKIVNRCRAVNVRVYAEIVINHMTGDSNDMNPIHYNDGCVTWGPKTGSGGSPFYTHSGQISNNYYTGQPPANEYPSVPYMPSDFHCGRGITDWKDPTQLCYGSLAGLQDLNTEKEYVQKRIATYIVDLISLGVSGFVIVNGRHIPNFAWAQIFGHVKYYLGNKLPLDFMAIINLENADMDIILCEQNEDILDFGPYFSNLLKKEGFKDTEIQQIKFWFKGNLAYEDFLGQYDASCDIENEDDLFVDVSRWTISLEYSDDINMGHDDYNIYIKHKNKNEHKNILINNLFLKPRFNWAIRFVFTSFSIDSVNGIPDGKSEKSFCESDSCRLYTVDLPFKRAFNPYSKGYDCGDGENNWIIGEYSRIHRDIDVINAMREWLYKTNEEEITEEELYTKDLEKTNCDEKCLICNEESKLLDKCIFCDSNKGYYPIMEIGGREEYYDCHKIDEKLERFFFSNRDKAFLPCYETCRYCNELGDINNHKCTQCDYNLIKNPGTKSSATTFNCVTSCSYNYYYTESGQYKCTNTPVCPQDKNIYIEEKQKCVSSCKEEAPLIYLFNGNCVKECPSGYKGDQINYLCIANNIEECSLGSKIETFDILYSSSTLNSYAKGYKDEYLSYSKNHITKIINPNYNIYIFVNFDCVKQLGLDIPDLRRITHRRLQEKGKEKQGQDKKEEIITTQTLIEELPFVETCYTKVQESLEFEDDLIVVYIEDISDVVAEKGYLLYNPRTGYKTNFETICGEDDIKEVEDITVDEDSQNKLLQYVYLRAVPNPTSCEEGLAPIFRKNSIDYSNCLAINQAYEGFVYDDRSGMFLPCHENCRYCSKASTSSENYCYNCSKGYIKHPLDERKENFNCVAECPFSYYFSSTGVYTCTPGPTCPNAYRYYISEKNQCIDSCKNHKTHNHTQNGNCVQNCEGEYESDDNGFCIQKNNNQNKCSYNKQENITLNNFGDNGGLDIFVKNYYEEYYYTDRHVSEYINSEYRIIIYIQKNCLLELNVSFPVIDFGECYWKVQNASGLLNNSLIVTLVKKLDIKSGRTFTTQSLYNPLDGTKLDAETICNNTKIVMEENVLEILQESGIDYENMIYLTDQNINIFDTQGAFYTDICFEFELPHWIDRDITLPDRLETFYPNVSLCDSGCESKGVNLTTMMAICSCEFKDITKAGDDYNLQVLNEVFDVINSSNIQVLKCMKFMFKKFDSSVGGFLMLFCLLIVISMGLIFYYKHLETMKKYIVIKTTSYINCLNEMSPEEEKKTNVLVNSIDDKMNLSKKNQNSLNSKIDLEEQKQDSMERKGDVLLLNKINNSKEVFTKHRIENKLSVLNKEGRDTNYIEPIYREDFKAYLAPNVDDQEFEEVMLGDKRTFREFFLDSLSEKQLFVNTFNVQDHFRPISIKIVLFTLTLILYSVINGFFYGEDEISQIYHTKGEIKFFDFIKRSGTRYLYSTPVGFAINLVIELFFVDEKKMKIIFIRERKNIVNLKVQITKLTKSIVIRYFAFIIFVIVVFILLMFYLLCFNYVYPYTQGDWVKSSIFLIIILQILSVLIALLQTGLRFFSFHIKDERIFRLSKYLD